MDTTDRNDIPPSVWLITTGIFAMVTSEFMAAGLLPDISRDIGVTVGAASMLISGFALGQIFGGWTLGMPLTRYGARSVLAGILVLFALAQTIGVLSPWPVLLALRMVSGLALAAYFTVALSTVTRLVPGEAQPQATARVFAGVTIGTTLGLPLATFAGQSLTWQWAFHADTVVVLLAAVAIVTALPALSGVAPTPARELVGQLADLRLWGTFVTAGLSIGGALVAFGFFSAILQDETGVAEGAVPWLLTLYGLASVVGNYYVGRVAHTGPTRVVAIGVAVMLAGLVVFRLAPGSLPVAILALVLVGGTGVSLNAAHTARTIAVGGATPAVMAMTPTIVTSGILLGTATGGVVADHYGVLAPLVVGAALASLALVSLVPELVSPRRESAADAQPCAQLDACSIAT